MNPNKKTFSLEEIQYIKNMFKAYPDAIIKDIRGLFNKNFNKK